MRNDSLSSDPKVIWQNQPTEPSAMTLEKIRQKTQELHAKNRLALLKSLTAPLVLVFFFALDVRHLPDPELRPVFASAIGWSLVGLYFLNRGMRSMMLPEDSALSSGLGLYRREVEQQSYRFRRFVLWSLGPVLLAVATLVFSIVKTAIGGRGIFNAFPFLGLLVLWIIGVVVIRIQDQRVLRQEIKELRDIEKANGT